MHLSGLDGAAPEAPPLRWLEIALDRRCNQRCLGCPATDSGPSLQGLQLVRALADGRRRGIHQLWIGGGEPTLRRELPTMVRQARSQGYTRVKLQTNAAMLGYPELVARLAEAGVTEVALSLKGADAPTHDRLARVDGAFEQLRQGLANVRAHALPLEGDVLLYRSTTATLPAIVRRFFDEGVRRFRVWAMAPDRDDAAALAEEPRLGELAAAVGRALALALSDDPEHLVSLHSPPCTLRGPGERARFLARELGLLVHDAGGATFRLEESPIEGGHFSPRCDGCSLRPRCGGVRGDYLARHGDGELAPQGEP